MKTTKLLIATTLASLALMATVCKPKVTDTGIRYVAVKDGLNMREEPSPSGKKMLTIPYRQEVQKLEEGPESFTIDKTEGKWTKVTWKGKTGWVFGGFLSSFASNLGAAENTTTNSMSACKAACDREVSNEDLVCSQIGRRNSNPEADAAQRACYERLKRVEENCRRNCS